MTNRKQSRRLERPDRYRLRGGARFDSRPPFITEYDRYREQNEFWSSVRFAVGMLWAMIQGLIGGALIGAVLLVVIYAIGGRLDQLLDHFLDLFCYVFGIPR